MEPSDRSPWPWRRWNVNAQDPPIELENPPADQGPQQAQIELENPPADQGPQQAQIELENPPADQDSSPQQAQIELENPPADQDPQQALIELENPPADQDSSPQQAQDACFEPHSIGAPPPSPPSRQQAQDACFESDSVGAPSPPSRQQAWDACFESDSVGAPSPPSRQQAQDGCFQPDSIGAPQVPDACFEPDSIRAPPSSPPSSVVVHGADNNDGRTSGEGALVPQRSGDEEEECSIGNPFLTDSFGNQTAWRLSDLNAEFTKYLEEEASKPKEKKFTKEESLKVHSNRMERYMKSALQKYNDEEKLSGDLYFEFDKIRSQNWIVEGDYDNQYYYHFNFSATQVCSTTCLFFAEVIPGDGDSCDITCCNLLNDGDNGHCYGCKNAHVKDLRHPACLNVYFGGHVDRKFPFLIDTESEDDSDDDTV